MARKGQVSIQDTVENDEEFEAYLTTHSHQLICMEVYSEFCGPCLATGNAVRKGKLDIGQDRIAMVKEGKLTRAMFGANGIDLCRIIEEELVLVQRERETGVIREKLEISEMLPEEAEKMEADKKLEYERFEAEDRLRTLTLAARKQRVCERLSDHVRQLNFILFWPHCHQAHYDLYEKWDMISISVAAKETFQLTEEQAREALYMSDVEPNEACLYALTTGEAMVVMFKMMESDTRDFVKLLRHALYVEIPVPKDDTPPEQQLPPIPAYERYATISKSAREVRRDRYEAKLQKLREEQEERDRLAAEQARLARQAEQERLDEEKQRREDEKMARLAAGLPAEPDEPPPAEEEEQVQAEESEKPEKPEGTEDETAVTEEQEAEQEKVEEEEEFHSDVSVEGEEYIPPGGLFVPGLYAPLNNLAKANGLAFFYPKIVRDIAPMESEHLPPHLLVMFPIDKRQEVMQIVQEYRDEIINLGVFVGDDIHNFEHLAYSVKQYEKIPRIRRHKDRLALMVSRKRSLPLLQLAGLNPVYISSDVASGEKDCLALFPVGYGDDFEEEESVVEEEVEVEVAPEPVVEESAHEKAEGEEDEEEEED